MADASRQEGPPQISSRKSSISRRDFLKLTGAALAAAAFGPRPPEPLPPGEFPVVALRIRGNNPLQVMIALEDLLENRRVGLVVSPEFTFSPSRESERGLLKLHLAETPAGDFKVLDSSGARALNYVTNASLLAMQSGSSIFLSSFSEYDLFNDNKYHQTMLHIDPNGRIVGRKRKYSPPEGNFTVKVGNKAVKVLPLVCQDA